MHPECYEFVSQFATDEALDICEFGSLNINGTVRPLFPNARYIGIDLVHGNDVDIVGDASGWLPDLFKEMPDFDLILCLEVLEHSPAWTFLVHNTFKHLCSGGRFILTCATNPRAPHSAVDGFDLKENEYYSNIDPGGLKGVLDLVGFDMQVMEVLERGDLQVMAVKP